jgi:hypothetical protein
VANIQVTVQLLARILIGKVEDLDRLDTILESVPVVQGDPNWRCKSWIVSAVEAIAKDGKAVGTSILDWAKIEELGRRTSRWHRGGNAAVGDQKLKAPQRHSRGECQAGEYGISQSQSIILDPTTSVA